MNTQKIAITFIAIAFTLMNLISPAIAAETSLEVAEAIVPAAIAEQSSARSAPEVRLYQHRDFRGTYQRFSADAATAEQIHPQLINQVSSLSVPSGVTVTLTDRQTGRRTAYTGSAVYVGDQMNDQADVVEITPDCPVGSSVC